MAEIRINTTGELKLYDSDSSNYDSFKSAGTFRGSLHTKELLEKGREIRNESHDLSLKFLEDANPTAIIGIFETLAILIIPADTLSLGPRGPSGVIPMYFLFFNNL